MSNMSRKAGVDFLYHGVLLLAVLQLSQAAWLPEPDVDSIPLSHQRRLQQTSGCSNSVWQCVVSAGERMRLSDSTHAAVLAGNCTQVSTSLRLWQCGDILVQGDLKAAVQQGSCSSECIDSDRQLCSASPAPAPAPSKSLLRPTSWLLTMGSCSTTLRGHGVLDVSVCMQGDSEQQCKPFLPVKCLHDARCSKRFSWAPAVSQIYFSCML